MTDALGRQDRFYNRGDVVLRRSRRGAVVTWVQATRVVRDDEDGLLLWVPAGSGFGHRADDQGRATREEPIDVVATRALVADRWKNSSVLIWNLAGAEHSLWWFFEAGLFTGWYVNLEIRGPRWSGGIDVADLGLDVVVNLDRTWSWKDEDDFATFTDAPGYWTAAEAVAARAEGLRVIALAEAGKFPFDGTYCDFAPDPTWLPPELPTGWGNPPS
ncbi:DUF402 domain-containing protein [Kribbella antibiotica]|uniref:DUF402 domain-containing protein n=1 Tax=Kribbella antibiotica TaxID=190195 RepID=A0A4R4ZG83_9ACTN|nr:DUF402 domain-containing protein [Kribbella antibiotica]TDD57056.1 DUF402 domain-containing protein [Kribbella antibiotica]